MFSPAMMFIPRTPMPPLYLWAHIAPSLAFGICNRMLSGVDCLLQQPVSHPLELCTLASREKASSCVPVW